MDPDLVEEGRVAIDRYLRQRGYFEAEVTSEIIEAPLDNAIQINYMITPGVSHRINEVRIVGNTVFTTEEIKKRLRTRKGELFNRGVFSPEIQEEDIRTIEAMYRNAGYEGTTVAGAYDEIDHVLTITLQIQEGKRLAVDLIGFVGNEAIKEDELRNAISLKEGDALHTARRRPGACCDNAAVLFAWLSGCSRGAARQPHRNEQWDGNLISDYRRCIPT